MNELVRLRYSGLILFASRIISILTGLAFSLIVIRSFSTSEFGAWTNIGNLVKSLGFLAPLFPFWAARFTARQFQGAMKLGMLANLFFASVASLVAAILAPFLALAAATSSTFYLYSIVLVVQSYLTSSLEQVVLVRRPQLQGYAFIAYEFAKVACGYVLVVLLGFGISGAILTLALANSIQTIIYAFSLRELWFERMHLANLWHWVKGSPLNFYGLTANLLVTIDVFLLLFRAGNQALASYSAALIIATPISYTSVFSVALYPRMLERSREEDVETSIKITLLFGIPLAIAVVGLASSLLNILKSAYVPSAPAAAWLAVGSLAGSMLGILDAIILGSERLDVHGTIALRDLFKSRILLATTGIYVAYLIYLPTLWLLLGNHGSNAFQASQTTAFLGAVAITGVMLFKYLIARRCLPFHFPLKSALKYTVVSGLIVSVVLLLPQPLPRVETVILFLLGVVVYFGVLYFVEEEARLLLRSLLARLRILRA